MYLLRTSHSTVLRHPLPEVDSFHTPSWSLSSSVHSTVGIVTGVGPLQDWVKKKSYPLRGGQETWRGVGEPSVSKTRVIGSLNLNCRYRPEGRMKA